MYEAAVTKDAQAAVLGDFDAEAELAASEGCRVAAAAVAAGRHAEDGSDGGDGTVFIDDSSAVDGEQLLTQAAVHLLKTTAGDQAQDLGFAGQAGFPVDPIISRKESIS